MQPPCSVQPCCNACFLSPFLTSEESHNKNDDLTSATNSTLYPNMQFTNHESLPLLQDSYHNFVKSFPQFLTTSQIDQIREHEYHHLNSNISNTCFDYTGFGLFSYSQLQKTPSITSFCSRLRSSSSSSSTPYLNLEQSFFDVSIKSTNLKSQILYGGHESKLESRIRERIMTFMNISETDYSLVFMANEVSAFKLVADSFKFQSRGSEILTVYDHNSEALEMMIDSCKKQEVKNLSAEFNWINLEIEWQKLKKMITCKKEKRKSGLFVFPLYSKVTGSPYSYFWMSMAQENGWSVMLDLCALRPKEMDTLGMSIFKPDFMVCSFYKIFGENPSGFGCLFVKKSSVSSLKDVGNATSIGIVSLTPTFTQCCQNQTERPNSELPETSSSEIVVNTNMKNERLDIECRGLDHANKVGLIVISTRTRYLINWLVNALMSLQHPHEEYRFSLIRIYGPKINSNRGPTVAFNIFDWKGEKIDPALVQKLADRNNISISKSYLKNIKFFDRNQEEREWALENKCNEVENLGLFKKKNGLDKCGILVLTATLGFLTNFEDVYRLWAFVSRFLDADFVEKERWRYIALNQKTIEV